MNREEFEALLDEYRARDMHFLHLKSNLRNWFFVIDDSYYLTYRDLADKIQTQLTEDVRRTLCADWTRRSLKNASYSESRMPKVPCALIEMLSHQNLADMKLGLDPVFKFTVARAIYKGILRFLHEQNGTPFVVQPLPVRAFAIEKTGESNIRLTWKETTVFVASYVSSTPAQGCKNNSCCYR